MKHLLLIAIIIGLGILTRAESEYSVSTDGKHKILKGLISRDMLEKDTAFSWFYQNLHAYAPDAAQVNVLRANAAELQFLVFTGTWCEEAQYILPHFFALMDAAAIHSDQITLIGVDPEKRSVRHLTESLHITSVPTFIVMRNGTEIGRITPEKKKANWEKELIRIVQIPSATSQTRAPSASIPATSPYRSASQGARQPATSSYPPQSPAPARVPLTPPPSQTPAPSR